MTRTFSRSWIEEDEMNEEVQDALEQDAPETVALAREMGWKPEEEWVGKPPARGFMSASEYVRRNEKIMPVVNARAKRAEERAQKLEAKIEQLEQDYRARFQNMERMSDAMLKAQRAQMEAEFAARKEAAVEIGDKAAYQRAVNDEKEAIKAIDDRLKDEEDDPKREPEKKALPKQVQEVVDAWLEDNEWFNKEPELNAVANARHIKLIREKPGLSLAENLAEVTKYVKKRFPEMFGEAEDEEEEEMPRRGSRVEGGTRINNGAGGRSLYAKLPAEAKAAADRFIKEQGLFLEKGETLEKNLNQARERYAKQYFGDEK
jgi:hypothetical protein